MVFSCFFFPCPDCGIWREYTLTAQNDASVRVTQLIRHTDYGLELRVTLLNQTNTTISNLVFSQELAAIDHASLPNIRWQTPARTDSINDSATISLHSLPPRQTLTMTAQIRP